MDDIMPLIIWSVVITCILTIIGFLLGIYWHFHKHHKDSIWNCPECQAMRNVPTPEPIPESKLENKSKTSGEEWGFRLIAFFIGVMVMLGISMGFFIPRAELHTVDGKVIDRGMFGQRYFVLVQIDDFNGTILNLTVKEDVWINCGYGHSFPILYYDYSSMIDNTTA